MIVYHTIKAIEPGVIPRPVRTLVVGISRLGVTCLGKSAIEETAYYEIATGAAHPRNDTFYDTLFVSKINSRFISMRYKIERAAMQHAQKP